MGMISEDGRGLKDFQGWDQSFSHTNFNKEDVMEGISK
jgi:hypothetical protein